MTGQRIADAASSRHNRLDEARAIYKSALEPILDFPEYLFDAWTTFEHQRGGLHDIATAEAAVAGKMRGINKRREEVRRPWICYMPHQPRPGHRKRSQRMRSSRRPTPKLRHRVRRQWGRAAAWQWMRPPL